MRFFPGICSHSQPVCSAMPAGTQVHNKVQTRLCENAYILNPKDWEDGGNKHTERYRDEISKIPRREDQ